MDRLRSFVREPALLLDFVETLLVLLVAFGVSLSHDQQAYIVAAIIAVIGLLKGISTVPLPVHLITDLGRAVLVLAASFGLHGLTEDRIAVVVTFLGTLTTLVGSIRTTPVNDPILAARGAGAGPVAGRDVLGRNGHTEVGATRNGVLIGVLLLVVGLIVWLLTGYAVIGIILIVVGIVALLLL